MKVEFINNRTLVNLGNELREQMKSCHSFSIAVAFLSDEALKVLEVFLKENKTPLRNGRIIVGLYKCFNPKEVLLNLQQLSAASGGKLKIRISRIEKFHWKYYAFENKAQSIVYIGSANFTASGIGKPGELQMKFTVSKADKSFKKQSQGNFATEWENAVDIEKIPLDKYKAAIIPPSISGKLDPGIRSLLFEQLPAKEITPGNPTGYVRISGWLLSSTVKVIAQYQSGWHKNKWDYFSCVNKYSFDQAKDRKFLFIISRDKTGYSFEIGEVKDYFDFAIPKDGRYFIAYKRIGKVRKETASIRSLLNDIGFNYKSRKLVTGKLSKKKAEQIGGFFYPNSN